MCGQKMELASLELEVRTTVNCCIAAKTETRSSAKVLFMSESSLQPHL